MTDLRKAAEMALEALIGAEIHDPEAVQEAIQALRQALAQPEQEPVGYVTIENISSWAQVPSIKWFKKPTQGPLYTAPPKREWVGMTDDETDGLIHSATYMDETDLWHLVSLVEERLKEKNT